ncbi:MAG: DUF6152 family protein [Steroidobacteraceae bacterium]|jgi:hypothetical protein
MPKKYLLGWALPVAMALLVAESGAWAHHSFAMYDETKTLHAQATIKEFLWGAPHSSVSLVVMNDDGTTQTMTLQGAAPTTIVRQGFTPRDFHAGMKVEVSWHPLLDGRPGGALMGLKLEDGRIYLDNTFGTPAG